VRDPAVAFLLLTMLPWEYLDRVRSGEREEPVLVEQDGGGGWASAAGFTKDDVGAELKVSGNQRDQLTLTTRNRRGEKISEHAVSVRWTRTPPSSGFEGGVVSSVQPWVGGAVRIDDAEVELTNPEVVVRRVFMWPNSTLDGACSDDGALAMPCMQFVAHRHCQVAFDNFFCGNYPDSKRCIEPHVGVATILLQAMVPFLPIIEVNAISVELTENATTRTDPSSRDPSEEGSLRSQYIEDHSQDDEDPQFKKALKEVHRAAARAEGGHKSGHHGKGASKPIAVAGSGSDGFKPSAMGTESSWSYAPCRAIVESPAFEALSVLVILAYLSLLIMVSADVSLPEEALQVAELIFTVLFTIELALKFVGLGVAETWSSNWNRLDLVVIVLSYASMALESLGSGVASLRALRLLRLLRFLRFLLILSKASGATLDANFYNIPKVKFTMWFASHVVYTLLLTFLGVHFSADRSVWHDAFGVNLEVLFYFWTAARLASEANEFPDDEDYFHLNLKAYLADPWNALDATYNLFVLAIIGLRVYAATLNADDLSPGEDHAVAVIGCNLFAVIVVLCYARGIQFLGYYQSVGVLTIVLTDMMNDIAIWTILSLVISAGFAFAFVILEPSSVLEDHSWALFMGLHPVYESIWMWVGAGVHSDRETIDGVTLGPNGAPELPTAVLFPSLMWVYQFIIGVLLVNLLIAMMSDTYARVMEKGRERWTFERAGLIAEFKDTKPPFPPPFNVLWQLFVELPAKRLGGDDDEVDMDGFKTVPDLKLLRKLEGDEKAHLKKCIEAQAEREQDGQDWQIRDLKEKLAELQEASRTQFETLTRQIEATRPAKTPTINSSTIYRDL